MLPLKDDLVSRSAPVMTVSIVTLNVLVFLYQTSLQLGISLEVDNPPTLSRRRRPSSSSSVSSRAG